MVLIEQEKSEGSPRPPIRVYLRESGWAQAGVTHGHVSEFVPGVEDRTLGPVLAGVALALIQLLLASPTYFEANECDSNFKQRTVPKRWTLKGGARARGGPFDEKYGVYKSNYLGIRRGNRIRMNQSRCGTPRRFHILRWKASTRQCRSEIISPKCTKCVALASF